MADTKISGLPAASAAAGANELPINEAGTSKKLTLDQVKTFVSGASWVQDVNEDGTSFANFTGVSGTWSSDDTIIKQTDTAALFHRAKYNTMLPLAYGLIFEAELRFPTAGQGGGSYIIAEIIIGYNGASASRVGIRLDKGTQKLDVDAEDGSVLIRQDAFTIALDTWYKVRAVYCNELLTVYVDGVLKGSTCLRSNGGTVLADYIGLMSYGSLAHFRNIKAWTLTGGAPA